MGPVEALVVTAARVVWVGTALVRYRRRLPRPGVVARCGIRLASAMRGRRATRPRVGTMSVLLDRVVDAPLFYLRWLPQLWAVTRLACPATGRRIALCVCLPCNTTRSD